MGFILFSIFCVLLVLICLLGTVMEISCKPVKAEIVENGGHISMDKGINEKTPLMPDANTHVEKGKMKMCQDKLFISSV